MSDLVVDERLLTGVPMGLTRASVQNSQVPSSVSATGRNVVWKRMLTSLSRSGEDRLVSGGRPT